MGFQKSRTQNQRIHTWFENQVIQAPDAVAVVFGTQQLSYRELNEQANQLAHYLQKREVQPETLVGICIERSPAMIVAMLAVVKAGGAYVPLDPSYPRERIELMLEDSQVSVLLTQQQFASDLPTESVTLVSLDADWATISQESSSNPQSLVTDENLAYVIYTSGSTGRPKGVMIEHRSLTNFVQAMSRQYRVTPSDRVLQFASISFDVAVEEIFITLVQGATIVLRSQEMLRSIPAFFQTCQAWNISILNLPTAFWHKICAEFPQVTVPECIRLVIIGSERAIPRWLTAWKQHVPDQIRLINAYGPTEATVGSTFCELAGPEALDTAGSRVLPIGKPIDNVQTHVLDVELRPVPVGVAGELYIAGSGLARGYLNRPDLTAIKFIFTRHGDQKRTRFYKTGDWVRYREDGHLEFLDRVDHQEKIRGFRIELREIETVLNLHPTVQQAIVIAREDIPGDKRLVAYVVPNKRLSNISILQNPPHRLVPRLRSYLQGKLPGYMVPAAFMLLNTLPMTPNGKVDRRALPAPTAERPALEEAFVPPRTSLEEALAKLWSAILGIAEIGVNDNFFELGGDSLQTTQLISQVEKDHQVVLQLLDFFRIPTVAGLANLIQQVHIDRLAPTEHMSLQQLQAEVLLADTIQPQTPYPVTSALPEAIFLTGGTGFVGSFLLCELLQQTPADIYCLVRAQSLAEAHHKLRSALEKCLNGIETFYSRIIPVMGDLAQPNLGLSKEKFKTLANSIDAVYHCGANVNLLYPYTALYSTNVRGTHEVLKFASFGQPKPVHYLSTLDVFESVAATGVRAFYEQDNTAQGKGISNGYAQSKWIAEQLVMRAAERGLPVCIYRPGMVTGHSQHGYSNTTDVLCRLVKSLSELQKAPDLNLLIDMTPIDYVSRAITYLSLQPQSIGRTFHVINPQPIAFAQLVNTLNEYGYGIQRVPYQQWQATLKLEPNALSPLVALIKDSISKDERTCLELWLGGNDRFDFANTLKGLQGQSIICPPANSKLFRTYLNYFVQCGFMEALEAISP